MTCFWCPGDDQLGPDQDLVDKNNAYVHTVNTAVVASQDAVRRAANAIEALFGGQHWSTVKLYWNAQ